MYMSDEIERLRRNMHKDMNKIMRGFRFSLAVTIIATIIFFAFFLILVLQCYEIGCVVNLVDVVMMLGMLVLVLLINTVRTRFEGLAVLNMTTVNVVDHMVKKIEEGTPHVRTKKAK